MLKQDFIKKIANETNNTQKAVREILENIEENIIDIITNKDSIQLKFGKIGGKIKPQRTGIDPRNGEPIVIREKIKGYCNFSNAINDLGRNLKGD